MPKQLSTQNATITTASVEVKTLTISGKQVTLAVFRQLREEPLIAEDGTLNGVPWGVVNYHPDKCGDSLPKHRHIVWQCGDELLRCRVEIIAPFDWPSHRFQDVATDAYAAWILGEWAHGRLDWCPLERSGIHGRYFCRWKTGGMSLQGAVCEVLDQGTVEQAEMAKHRLDQKQREHDKHAGPWQIEELTKARDAMDETLAALDAEIAELGPIERIRSDYNDALAAEVGRRQRHRDVRTGLAALPQLFIAV